MWEELGQRRKRVFLGITFSPPQKPSAVHGRGPCLPQPLPVTSASRKVMEHGKAPPWDRPDWGCLAGRQGADGRCVESWGPPA